MCCFISTAIGTSMGTIAAMAPVAIGVATGAGLNPAIVGAAVIGGSYFGDNLSMISDTTISAAQGCGSEMKDKFRMNFFIALPAAIVALVLYTVLGGQGSGTIEAGAYSVIQVLPYIVVLVSALMGINVALVLFIGILMTGVIGIAQGTVGFFEWIQAIGTGMSDMFSISIVAILISGIIGLVRYYGGVEWMVNAITAKIHSRRSAEYGIGLLSGILSGALVNNTIAIIVTCPIAKEIGGKFGIAPKAPGQPGGHLRLRVPGSDASRRRHPDHHGIGRLHPAGCSALFLLHVCSHHRHLCHHPVRSAPHSRGEGR